MHNNSNKICFLLFIILITISTSSIAIEEDDPEKDLVETYHHSKQPKSIKSYNQHGVDVTYSSNGVIDFNNAFLKNLALMIELVLPVMCRQRAGRLHPKEQKNALTKQKA